MARENRLILIATNNPELYRQFLGRISAGCSLASSCSAIGLRSDTASKLLNKATTIKDGRYRKIARDIRGAIAKAMQVTEAELRKLDPKYWLKHGPGRILTNEWNDESNNVSNNNNPASNISSDDIISALIQLHQCGISIDNLIESGQIKTLKIDAGAKSNINIISAPTSGGDHAGSVYGESSCTFSTLDNNSKPTKSTLGISTNLASSQPNNYNSTNAPLLVNKTNGQAYDGSLVSGKVVRETPKIKTTPPVETVIPTPDAPPVVDVDPAPRTRSSPPPCQFTKEEMQQLEEKKNARNQVLIDELDVLPDGLKKFLDSKQ